MSIGTSGCFTSLDHCGTGLKGVEGEAGALFNKPLPHVVEVSITWETRGPSGHKRNKSCQTFLYWTARNTPFPPYTRGGHVCCSKRARPLSTDVLRSHSFSRGG